MLKKTDIILVSTFVLLIFFLLRDQDFVSIINTKLILIIESKPLSKYYFPFFCFISLLPPIFIRFLKSFKKFNFLLDSYLLLLFIQILNEFLILVFIGKGFTVLIGLFFSSIRVFQIKSILNKLYYNSFIYKYFVLLIILWFLNIFQILIRRIIPLIV